MIYQMTNPIHNNKLKSNQSLMQETYLRIAEFLRILSKGPSLNSQVG